MSRIPIDSVFNGKLYDYQHTAVEAILKHDNGILWASTAFGKTVVAANIISSRNVSTLIIVNSIQLIEQWEEKLKIFLETNKNTIGRLGGGKKKVSNIIDIATMQTLNKIDDLDNILNNYGQIIIDECHHIAAFTFEKIMKAAKSKYILGLTATPNRKDKYDKIITMPISWEGVLEQYAGRLQRMYEGKNIVKIYDYIDNNVPILVKMYNKRLKGYKNLDYNINENAGVQYEFDNV
ncbi:DEAD/DEAH box helicase family protein [Clostridium sp. BL-8]|uniref:DEAD/DEAH box helicase n=1 Tax=Clostridium sp. BL-8 TaxID=349938 RepID=UPI0009D0C18B|nr:DEAD/DEAH box helicase family protein [Clostridium sp. BL-8]OOM68302.1 type III restriction enzyme, res subunit [Clostridium sp. BL-8]